MYVSLSRLRVPEDRADELVAAFRARAGLVEQFDGFLNVEVWQNDRDPGELTMVSHWTDRASFTAYMKSDEHKVSHGRVDPELDALIKLEKLEHLTVVAT